MHGLGMVVVMFALLAATGIMAAPQLRLGVAPLTEKVFRDSHIGGHGAVAWLPGEGLELWGARNEKVSIQLVITAGDEQVTGVLVSLAGELAGPEGARIGAEHVELLKVHYTRIPLAHDEPVPQGKPYPDALPPLRGPFNVAANENQPVWVKISISTDCPPGVYQGALVVAAEGVAPIRVPVTLHVWAFALPVTPSLRTAFGLEADSPGEYRHIWRVHGIPEDETDSPQARHVALKYWEMLVEHRLAPWDLPMPVDSPAALPHLRDPRLTSFSVRNIGEMQYVAGKGLLAKALCYPIDEPRPERYDRLVELAREFHQANSDCKIMTPIHADFPVEVGIGSIDIWCPKTLLPPEMEEKLRVRQVLGEEVWLYISGIPRGDYCHFFINQDGLCHRLLFWQLYDWGADGFLFWDTTHWRPFIADVESPHPYKNPFDDNRAWCKNGHTYGAGLLLYPGAEVGIDGPVSSQRLECILAGMQDIEYFELLSKLSGQAAAREIVGEREQFADFLGPLRGKQAAHEIISQMTSNWVHYSRSDRKLEKLRRLVGETLAGHYD